MILEFVDLRVRFQIIRNDICTLHINPKCVQVRSTLCRMKVRPLTSPSMYRTPSADVYSSLCIEYTGGTMIPLACGGSDLLYDIFKNNNNLIYENTYAIF